jgi:hypothetical protein
MQTPKHVNKYLAGASHHLHQIFDHCSQLQCLNRLVREYLPAPLNQHCQVANIRDRQLILIADSSAWATMLHYQADDLLQYLKQQPGLEHICNIRTRTRPQFNHSSDIKPSPDQFSHQTAALIGNLADSMSNPALKKALQRLARHSEGSSK